MGILVGYSVFAPLASGQTPRTPADSDSVGVVLGDSVVRGFGSSPVYYNEQGPSFKRSAYRFVSSADKPIICLDGYEGIHKWLNRGVTANGTNATRARWMIDVESHAGRGAQTKHDQVKFVLVSSGFMDIAQGVLRNHLASAEANVQKNLLAIVRRAKADRIGIAILEIPDPKKAPLGQRFHTNAGTPVIPFYEEQKLSPKLHRQFDDAVQRYRFFLENVLAPEGAIIVDYASFLSPGYFWDSHHPSDPGYIKLGKLLASRYPGPTGSTRSPNIR